MQEDSRKKYVADNAFKDILSNPYYLTEVGNIFVMTADFIFEKEIKSTILSRFNEIPMPTSATILSNKRALFHMATCDPFWQNTSYWFRYLICVETFNGKVVSINNHDREIWQWSFDSLGPRSKWTDYDGNWPRPDIA